MEIHGPNAIEIYEKDFRSGTTETSQTSSSVPTDESPQTLSSEIAKPNGTTDAILKILGTAWGRAKLRTWTEVHSELERVGYQFSSGAISGAFTNLFNDGKIRRQKIGRAYCYGLPLTSA